MPDDGAIPVSGVIQGFDGNFYGTTSQGGNPGPGTVFQITPQGHVTILHSFSQTTSDGNTPEAGLIQGNDGNFYGTTDEGGTVSQGTIFQITPQGTETILHNFGSVANDGASSFAPLVQSSAGNFYGITLQGGVSNKGTIYSIIPSQAPIHAPVFTGSAYATTGLYTPFTYTPKAAFGTSGSGVEIGNARSAADDGRHHGRARLSLRPAIDPQEFLQHQLDPHRDRRRRSSTQCPPAQFSPPSIPLQARSAAPPTQAGTFALTMTPSNSNRCRIRPACNAIHQRAAGNQ